MNFSLPFILRPIGTTLLAIGLFLLGAIAYVFLPVASLPTVDFPVINVSASRPGADPATMAASVAATLERRLGEIAGVTEITSVSSLGATNISVQFDLSRNIEGAARDVQAALNAATADLPTDLPQVPTFRKVNPSASPILILALTSDTMNAGDMYDVADTVIAQRMMQVDGVAQVTVSGADQPAVRVQVNPAALASTGIAFEDVNNAIASANTIGPVGTFDGPREAASIDTNRQLRTASQYKTVVIKAANGTIVRLIDIANVVDGVKSKLSAAWFNARPSVLLIVTRQANANVLDTVDRINKLIVDLKRFIPPAIKISLLSDRTQTIRASVHDMQVTLGLSIVLVMVVVFLFLRRPTPTLAAGVTVPLSLAGTCALMWVAGFSIDNLSLMALAVSVGFVVDDAIVMIENMFRNLESGLRPMRAAIEGARQIGFTVVSISISLTAAFIPLLFMGGIVGRLFREFSLTLVFAILVSTVVSLTVTPMVCAHLVRQAPNPDHTWFDRVAEAVLGGMVRFYARTLAAVLSWRWLALLVMAATVALTVNLYIKVPKGYFPQDDTGLLFGSTEASTDVSFKAMTEMQQRAATIVMNDPAVAAVGSSIGTSGYNPSPNQGRLFISLKPLSERKLPSARVVDRLRKELSAITGIKVFMTVAQDLRTGARASKATYQFTLWDPDLKELETWTPRILDAVKKVPGLVDVSTDREQGGLQSDVVIDRTAAAQMCVQIQDIDNALNDAYSQRQVSIIYTQRNQYRVVLEVDPRFQLDPTDLDRIYVPATTAATAAGAGCNNPGALALLGSSTTLTGTTIRAGQSSVAPNQVPLSAVAHFERSTAPLVVNHQYQFPSVTITYNLTADAGIQAASDGIVKAVGETHPPDTLHAEFAGDAQAFAQSGNAMVILILAALIAVYLVLGVLYESLAHPLTIISTLPSAGLGALLALLMFNTELTVIAIIGIVLLIGIVKKNGIMLVDFALEGERHRGLTPERAIYEACLERFRPILMTTMAALLGAVPLAIATGPGSELRRPLGLTIIGGLIVSQVLTLYTTPVIYLLLDRLHQRLGGRGQADVGTDKGPQPPRRRLFGLRGAVGKPPVD